MTPLISFQSHQSKSQLWLFYWQFMKREVSQSFQGFHHTQFSNTFESSFHRKIMQDVSFSFICCICMLLLHSEFSLYSAFNELELHTTTWASKNLFSFIIAPVPPWIKSIKSCSVTHLPYQSALTWLFNIRNCRIMNQIETWSYREESHFKKQISWFLILL